MTANVITKCWICGEPATTGEHKTKRTDLRNAFPTPTQSNPLFLHDAKKPNHIVRSFDAKILKSPGRICAYCNNARTQPHDIAWEEMSAWLLNRRPALKAGNIVRGSRIFPYGTRKKMLGVHLFFIKQFGCMVMESDRDIPIACASLANAILGNRPHPNIYLKFATGRAVIGRSNFELQHSDDFAHIFASWMYELDWITVIVMFATPGEQRMGLINAWHPKLGTNKLLIADGNPQPATVALDN